MRRLPITLALVAMTAPVSAQNVHLRATDGETEHQLYASGLMGVYIVGPARSPVHTRVACAVRLQAEGARQRLEIHAPIQLGSAPRAPCDASAFPQVALNEAGDRGALFAGSRELRTESDTYASLSFPSEAEAIGAAASIAQALGSGFGDCGYLDSDASNAPPRDHTFYCWTGLSITVSEARIGLSHRYARQVGHCEGFAEAHDFREVWIGGNDSLCARGRVLFTRASRGAIEEALGPCRGSESELRCGANEVRIRDDGSIHVRRVSAP